MALVISSCGGGGGGSGEDNNLTALTSLDLTGAESIFIRSASNKTKMSGSSAGAPADLYKVLETGEIDIVDYLDSGRNKIKLYVYGSEVYPVYINNFNNNYIFVGFTYTTVTPEQFNSGGLTFAAAVLVRKSDGAVYKIKDMPYSSYNGTYNFAVKINETNSYSIKSDNLGNIYYCIYGDYVNNHDIRRILKTNLANMTSTVISPSTERVNSFEVDNSGNILYNGYSALTDDDVTKIRSASGIYSNFNLVSEYPVIWKGYDGLIYFCSTQYDGLQSKYVSIVKKINPNSLEAETYGEFPEGEYPMAFSKITQVNLKENTYLISDSGIYEVYNSTASPRKINLAGMTINRIYSIAETENYYYIAGKDSLGNYFLIRVTPGGD